MLLFYLPVLIDLVKDWYTDANYSHGFIVPLITAYLIWRRRRELAEIEIESCKMGLVLIILGIAFFIVGNAGSEYFTVRLSLVVTIFGLVLYNFGLPFIRRTWFAFCFLLFMIPIPYVVYFSLAFPMQLLASKISVVFLGLIGMPIVQQGNILHLPGTALEVAEACSGMRSLVSLLALGAIYAYISQKRPAAMGLLFISAVPIAIISNIIRVIITSLIAYTAQVDITAEPLHSIMGASVFLVAFIIMFLEGKLLRRIFR